MNKKLTIFLVFSIIISSGLVFNVSSGNVITTQSIEPMLVNNSYYNVVESTQGNFVIFSITPSNPNVTDILSQIIVVSGTLEVYSANFTGSTTVQVPMSPTLTVIIYSHSNSGARTELYNNTFSFNLGVSNQTPISDWVLTGMGLLAVIAFFIGLYIPQIKIKIFKESSDPLRLNEIKPFDNPSLEKAFLEREAIIGLRLAQAFGLTEEDYVKIIEGKKEETLLVSDIKNERE